MKNNTICLFLCLVLVFTQTACKRMIDPSFNASGYPPAIEKIVVKKCATSGCHNDISYTNAGNLNLTTWDNMMKGAVNGSVVIPYSPKQSSLLQFVNTYSDLGVTISPSMPLNASPLSREDVLVIRDWIQHGCPDVNGKIPFDDNYANRPKTYLTNQGCDLVSIIDVESQLVMRYVSVGHDPNQVELPHNVKVSPDGRYWYVCFSNGAYFQKFDSRTDQLVQEVNITQGLWNVVKISGDGNLAYISDLTNNGRIVVVDLVQMKVKATYSGSGLLIFPHGIALSQTGDTIYATAQYGNMIYRIIPALPQIDAISLQPGQPPVTTAQLLDPHEVIMSPDYSKYFVTCQTSNEVRVMDARTDTLLKVIPVGIWPLEFAISKNQNLLFVTCQEDQNPVYPFFRGSIYVIDMNTLTVVHKIYEKFFQPHGLAVHEGSSLLFVGSRNADPNGPAPHHVSECAGRNGFYHAIDILNWQSKRPASEVSVDPYSMDIKQ
ncbi:MAG: hypothetical protein JNJ58_03625 [Chitinophagaceae bacterium]|nr:hypothetical protein [Chitinophagaceae bacterium]